MDCQVLPTFFKSTLRQNKNFRKSPPKSTPTPPGQKSSEESEEAEAPKAEPPVKDGLEPSPEADEEDVAVGAEGEETEEDEALEVPALPELSGRSGGPERGDAEEGKFEPGDEVVEFSEEARCSDSFSG